MPDSANHSLNWRRVQADGDACRTQQVTTVHFAHQVSGKMRWRGEKSLFVIVTLRRERRSVAANHFPFADQ